MIKKQAEYPAAIPHPHIRFIVTPNCNLSCMACQPGGEAYTRSSYFSEGKSGLILPKEIQKLAEIATDIGFSPIKITGGEPLIRPDITEIISACKEIPGAVVNLGTNGLLLGKMAFQLKEAGVDSLNVGLNTLDRKTYERETGVDGLQRVLNGIEKARGLKIPVNVNVVLMKQNFKEFDSFIELATRHDLKIRILPLSNLGNYSYWRSHYMPCAELERYIVEKYGTESNLMRPWSGLGTPMSTFFINDVEVRIINPENGVFYADFCQSNDCGNYPCIDGIWALRIDTNGDSKYCFFPRSGRKTFNYLNALRNGKYSEIRKRMKEDFNVLNSAQLKKKWNPEDEDRKYVKTT